MSDRMANFKERMEEYKERLPEQFHDTFEEMVGNGVSPQGAASGIYYETSDLTQQEVADKTGISIGTVRKNARLARYALGQSVHRGKNMSDFLKGIADILDWDEGDEYNLNQANIKRDGMRELYQVLSDNKNEKSGDAGDEK